MHPVNAFRCPQIRWQRALAVLVVVFCLFGFARDVFGQADQVSQLTDELKDANWVVRLDAAFALGKLKDPVTVEALVATLKDVDSDVRRTAATALGEIKDLRAVDPLIAILHDIDPLVRGCTVASLGKIGDSRAVPPLIPLLQDEDATVRRDVADWLAYFKDPRAVEPLIAALKDTEPVVQLSVARALGEIKDPRVEVPLVTALKEKADPVVSGAYKFFIGLGEAGSEETLISALNLFGNKQMALDFLNCGNPELAEAGRAWAKTYGYLIVADPNSVATTPVLWGSERLVA
jgi:HEAT repeat protein